MAIQVKWIGEEVKINLRIQSTIPEEEKAERKSKRREKARGGSRRPSWSSRVQQRRQTEKSGTGQGLQVSKAAAGKETAARKRNGL